MTKKVSVESLENGNTENNSESYLKDIRPFILFAWILGYFPFSFDKNLKLIKFSWISWSTLSSLVRICVLIIIYDVGYTGYLEQHLSHNIADSKVHGIMMANEFIFTSLSDLFIFACFPKLAEHITKLIKIFGKMAGKRKKCNVKAMKYYFYGIMIAVMYVCGVVVAFNDARDVKDILMICTLLISGFLRNVLFNCFHF